MEVLMENLPLTCALVGAAGILFSLILAGVVKGAPAGNEKMQEIAGEIQDGVIAYLSRQLRTMAVVGVIFTVIIFFGLGKLEALGFVIGAVSSFLAGYIGMRVSVIANVRTAEASRNGLNAGLSVSFKGGTVTGMIVAGLALTSTAGFYALTGEVLPLVALGFGGSLISIFARFGGGIFAKGADVGAGLVSKIEAGIPEDDSRNPASIAGNVGDNVGGCAGMAADLFETYVVTLVAAMLLVHLKFPENESIVVLPFILGAISIIASMIASFLVRLGKQSDFIMGALYKGVSGAAVIAAVAFYFACKKFATGLDVSPMSIYYCTLAGLILTVVIAVTAEYYTSIYKPVKDIAKASVTGHGTNLIAGIAVSMQSTAVPVLAMCLTIGIAHFFAGFIGIAMAAVAMLSMTGMVIAIDAYGSIADNASGIAEMAELEDSVRETTDAVGNTTQAVTKVYAIGSAGLAALVLFSCYVQELSVQGGSAKIVFDLSNVQVLIGLFIGALLPYLFGSIAMNAVGRAGDAVVEEARRQFREIEGIMEYKAKPDYAACVDTVTAFALKEMIVPALLAVGVPVIVGLLLGKIALGGMLIGAVVTGVFAAISMTTGGAAWDNAKKFIEDDNYGGKGSDAHNAAITGGTVGDAYKDTAGPGINSMIKTINVVALLLVLFLI